MREGIGLFLTPDLPHDDLWEQAGSGLTQHLQAHPELERQLMDVPPETLAPADQFFRALVLEEQEDYVAAQRIENLANQGLYTPEYTAGKASQLDYVVASLAATGGPVVDLASGRCYLVEKLVRGLQRPVVATDFSPRVLRRDRRWLQALGLYERVSLLAFDARRTPFKDGAVGTLTTNLGLPNVKEPGRLLRELRRVVDGVFLAIFHFFPPDDASNARAIRETELETFSYRHSTLEQYVAADWAVEVKNVYMAAAQPTPAGVVLQRGQNRHFAGGRNHAGVVCFMGNESG